MKRLTGSGGTESVNGALPDHKADNGAISPTLTQEAYERLEEMIITLELAPGEAVSEAILSGGEADDDLPQQGRIRCRIGAWRLAVIDRRFVRGGTLHEHLFEKLDAEAVGTLFSENSTVGRKAGKNDFLVLSVLAG